MDLKKYFCLLKHWIVNFVCLIITFSLLLFQSCERNSAATIKKNNFTHSLFTDIRDNKTYRIISYNSVSWFQENLKFDTLRYEHSDCMNNDSCDITGRLYTYNISKNVCPAGWHLPSDKEWKDLEKLVGMPFREIERSGIMRGIETDEKKYQDNLKEINIKYYGSAAFINNVLTHKPNNYMAGYWTSTVNTNADSAWTRFIFPELNIGRIKLDVKRDSSLLYIRCVRN